MIEFRELAIGDKFKLSNKPEEWIKIVLVGKSCCSQKYNAARATNSKKKTFFSDFSKVEKIDE